MGQVYLAEHHLIARRVAVKVLLPELSANEEVIARFFTEARATSVIRHPGIVEVLDCDVLDGQAFIVMEYLEGESLAGYLARTGGLHDDYGFALAVIGQVAIAVGAAHACDIVHRDLKPDNVFLCASSRDSRVVTKVLDFGIAKVAQQSNAAQTRTGALIGTPSYMSPEQCRGGSKAIDGRSDVYSLGCILYEALCGRPPFIRDGVGELIVAHVAEMPDDPRSLVPGLPSALGDLVMRMLAKNPNDRPPTMSAILGDVVRCLESIGVGRPLAEIAPRLPVMLPPPESSPPATATPMPAGPPRFTAVAPTPPPSMPLPVVRPGATRMLDSGTQQDASDGRAERSLAPTTLRGAVGERPYAGDADQPRLSGARWRIASVTGVAVGALAIVLVLFRPKPREIVAPQSPPPSAAIETSQSAPSLTPAPGIVTIDVRGLPDQAAILVDGAPVSGPPLKLRRDDTRHLIVARANGYYDRRIEIDANRDQTVNAAMTATSGAENPLAHESRPRSSNRLRAPKAPTTAAARSPTETDKAPSSKPSPGNAQKKPNYDDM
jgi:tRNA A-37 threonylcarbamoyl transferase component Bud32